MKTKRQDTHFLLPVRGLKKSWPSEALKPSLTAWFFASLAVPATISAFNFVIGPRHSTCSARTRFLDFPGDFHAFPPLKSELMTDHATQGGSLL